VTIRLPWHVRRVRRLDLASNSFAISNVSESTLEAIFAKLRPAAEMLAEIESRSSSVVDIDVMVKKAILGEAQLKLAMKTRASLPKHLVLIQRLAVGDHFASLADEVVRQLRRRGAQVSDYTFGSEPTIFVRRSGHSRVLTIDDLGREHGSDRLLILSDVSPFFGESEGELQRWVREFYSWRKRAILTPTPQAEWDYREATLAAEDFLLIPASRIGLEAVAQEFSYVAETVRGLPRNAGLGVLHQARSAPERLRSRAERFFAKPSTGANPAATYAALCEFLGSQVTWISACAIYPVLHWNLTLLLGHELARANVIGPVELDALFEISSLPWFREGRIPSDVRAELVSQLSASERHVVREILQRALEQPVVREGARGRFALTAEGLTPLKPTLWHRFVHAVRTSMYR
jgi:hypothetical protein